MQPETIALIVVLIFVLIRLFKSISEITDQIGYKQRRIKNLTKIITYLNSRLAKSNRVSFYFVEHVTSTVVIVAEVYIVYVLLKVLNVIGG